MRPPLFSTPWLRFPFNLSLGVIFLLSWLSHFAQALHSTDTITSGGDNTRSGYQPNHNMDPAVVQSPQFGVLWRQKLKGNYNGWTEQIFAQPLVYTPPSGEKQYVYIASQMNWIYKLDALTGEILASKNLHIPFLVSELDGCNDISFCIGSTATGVIDPATNTWYFTMKTYRDQTDQEKGRLNGRYYVHAVDCDTLEEKPNFPVNLEGLIAYNNPIRMFLGGNQHQRPALMQSGPYIYAGFASHCVQYNFTGWIIGWHGVTGEIVEAFATEGGPEDAKGAGVWMSGGGLASDFPNRMFFATGNGYANQLKGIPVPGRQPPTALEEAVVHMSIQGNGRLQPVDFFMPWEKQQLDAADKDLGTSGFALLDPGTFTSPTVKRMGCIAGKSGKLYFLNLDDLGGYSMGPNGGDAVLGMYQAPNSVFATAGSYPLEGGYVYVNPVRFPTAVFKYGLDEKGLPSFTKVAETDETSAYVLGVGHGGTTSMNGQPGTGIYWMTDIQGLHLRAYKAVPENGKLIRILGLNIPGMTKFSRPAFGNGRLYLTTTTGYVVGVGSPVNLPLDCSAPIEFGNAVMGENGTIKDITCTAKVAQQVSGIGPQGGEHWSVQNLPTLPLALAKDQTITFQATFLPTAPGPLSDNIYINSTANVGGYSPNTPIAVRGISTSNKPILLINPNTISFPGLITGETPEGLNETFFFKNLGSTPLIVNQTRISDVGENGPFLPPGTTSTGAITFFNLPEVIPPESEVVVTVNFKPIQDGSFPAYLTIVSNGGTVKVTVVATSGSPPKAKIEFERFDGTGWDEYDPNAFFNFGPVTQSTTRNLRLRLSNIAPPTSPVLTLTISKPPIGAGKIIAAVNGIDLGEGTQIFGGTSAEAVLYCSVPKSQPNVDPYLGDAVWTMNSNDPTMGKVEIRFKCNAVAQQRGPLRGDGQARYRFIGCFKENNPGRQLQRQLYGAADNENGKCITACAEHSGNYIFAGTQYHRECWCGNIIPHQRVNDNDCNFDCTGDQNQWCGGNGYFGGGSYISLFADSDRFDGNQTIPTVTSTTIPGPEPTVVPGGPYHNPGDGVFSLMGCYSEPSSGRALSVLTGDDNLTAKKCWEYCNNYNYAGLEYGRECWCGNTLAAGAAQVPLTECSMVCKGNSSEYCGKGGRLNLYTKIPVSSDVPSGSPSTSMSSASTSTVGPSGSESGSTTSNPTTVLSTTTSITSTQTASPTPDGWEYLGCANETTPRALNGGSVSGSMTIEKCKNFCLSRNLPLAGVEYGNECYCGTELQSGSKLGQSNCNMPCSGDATQTCGGSRRLSVYNYTLYVPPMAPAAVGTYIHQGCWSDSGERTLTGYTFANSTGMTVEMCIGACAQRGFQYGGVEYGQECFCGNTLSASTTLLPEERCRMLCKGNIREYCGGPGAMNLYMNNPTDITVAGLPVGVDDIEEKRRRSVRRKRGKW